MDKTKHYQHYEAGNSLTEHELFVACEYNPDSGFINVTGLEFDENAGYAYFTFDDYATGLNPEDPEAFMNFLTESTDKGFSAAWFLTTEEILAEYSEDYLLTYLLQQMSGKAPVKYSPANSGEKSDWMEEYWDNDGEQYRDLDAVADFDAGELPDMNRYEIIFDFNGVRRYCFVDAVSMDEALGNFFRNHHNVAYNNIVEHMEV